MMMSDSEIVQAVRAGDRNRYAELVERYQKMVYGIAWSRLGDADLCEDAAQETFVKAFSYLVALRNPAKFSGWLARIARNVSISLLRRRNRERDKRQQWRMELPPVDAADTPFNEGPSVRDALSKTLADLPELHRECLVLFYMKGKSVREAAELLGISEAAMKTRLHRARQALRGRLEEELERSLAGLGPRAGFSASIMPALPAAPLATAGIGGAVAKALGFFGKSLVSLSVLFWMSLFQGAFVAAMFGWFGRLEAANLAAGPGHGVRKRVIRSNVVALAIVATLTLVVSATVSGRFGPLVLFRFLAVFCLWGTYSAARMLRVNRSPFTVGVLLSNVAFLLSFVLIGFFHAPFWTFFAALLVLNIVLYQTNKTRPMRHDYNLFLRQAQGLLGEPGQTPRRVARLTRNQMQDFIRFLGARFFLRDYRLDENGAVLFLPPVKPGLAQFLSYTSANSTVTIDSEGHVEAHLGAKDLRSLHALLQGAALQKDVLERQVAEVVDTALRLVLAGQPGQAEALLQAEADEEVFRKPTAVSSEHRVRGILAIGAALFLLLTFGTLPNTLGVRNYRPPRRISQAMAREAIATWCRQYPAPSNDFITLMNSEKHPPFDFVGAENQAAYKKMAAQLLTEADRGDPSRCVYNNLRHPRRLYHVLDAGILTRDELAELGLSSKTMREALTDGGREKLREMAEHSSLMRISPKGTYTAPDINGNAYRLACLKAFDCLDFVDGESLANDIAANQIAPGWQAPDGYAPVDVEKAAGLFDFGFCNLRATRGALWSLGILGRLDLVDREACLEGILRFYQGRGRFWADHQRDGIQIYGNEDDLFYAMESLAILDGFDRIKDVGRWQFEPKTSSQEQNGEVRYGLVTSQALISWAYQLRLEELRGD